MSSFVTMTEQKDEEKTCVFKETKHHTRVIGAGSEITQFINEKKKKKKTMCRIREPDLGCVR